MRLLVAEKDPITRSLITSALAAQYKVTAVPDGSKAAGAITEAHEYGEPFDVVVLNVELSDQGSGELLRLLKALEEPRALVGAKSSKVVFLSKRPGLGPVELDVPALLENVSKALQR